MTEKQKSIKALEDAKVDFKETDTLVSLKEQFPEILADSGDEDESEEDAADESTEENTTDGKSVSFTLHDRNSPSGHSTRTFDEATHGKDYKKVAAEFAETNKHVIIK